MPVVLVAAAVAAAQLYQSEKARGANQRELDALKADFDSIVPPRYDVSVMDPPEFIKAAIPEPTMDMSSITPEQYKIVGKYTPDIAPFVAEQNPSVISDTAIGKEGQRAQLDALRKLKMAASEEGDPELAQAVSNAGRQSQIQAQSRQQSILQDLARRGVMNSGAGLAAQLQGSSDAMNQAANSSQDAAVQSYRNRLQALRDSAQLGGSMRSQELDLEGRNVGIINDFNQRTAKNAQQWGNQRSSTLNDAQLRNLEAQQSIANQNVGQNNKFATNERDRRDALQKYLYDIKRQEQDRQNNIIGQESNWSRGERDNQNSLASKAFADKMNIASGRHGIANSYMNQNNQTAADRNQAIQGFGNAAVGIYQANQSGEQRRQQGMQEDDRAYMEKHGTWMSPEEKKARYGA